MKILHTSDWHIGKRLGRHDRMGEFAEVLAEVEAIADDRAVDLVLVSGDIWDRPMPPIDALHLGLQTLLRLAERRPVVAVAGNHDSAGSVRGPRSPAPAARGVPDRRRETTRPGRAPGSRCPRRARCGGWVPVPARGPRGRLHGRSRRVVPAYAQRVTAITRTYNEALVAQARGDAVPILMAHFMVGGVAIDRGAPRGERELHMGDAYAATAQAIPAGPQYVAMGHIHAPQAVPGAPVPAHYAGSLLALDFGEAGEQKRVVIVDAEPGQLATIESIPLTKGRPLIRITDDWDAIEARAQELAEAFLDLTVRTSGTDMTLADRAGEAFPYLVKVRALRPEGDRPEHVAKGGRSKDQLYAEYYEREHGEPAPEELLILFRDVLEEAADASA